MSKMLANKDETLWTTRIQKSLEWRRKFSCETNWPIIDRYYRHDFGDVELYPRFNLIYMMGQTLIPNLVFQSPGILNTAQVPELTFLASVWDSIDNWYIKHSEMRDVAGELVLSSFLHNTTLSQTGYDFDTPSDQMRNLEQEMFGDLKGSVNRSRGRNCPWVDVIPSARGIVSVGTRTMRNCPWAGKLVSVPTRVLKEMKGLSNVRGTKIPDEILRHERATWDNKDIDKWTHFWEIHDAEKGEWFWLGTHGKFIMKPEPDPLQVKGLPFEVLTFNKSVDSIFGTPDAEYIRSQQIEGDEVRLHNMYQRRFSLPKMIYDTNVIKPEDIEKMLTAQVAPGIPADLGEDPNDDLRKHIHVFTPPTSYLLHREIAKDILNDAQLINGFGPNQLGTFAPGRRTKYEAQVVEGTNNARMSYRRSQVANVIQGHVERANMLIADNWTGEIVERVVGVDGALYWVKGQIDQLQGIKEGLLTEVNVESLAPVSRERRKGEASQILSMLGGMQDAGMNTMPLIKQLLSCYEWLDVTKILPQMDGQYELEHWLGMQKKSLSQGAGQAAARNLSGIQSLGNRLPSEGIQEGETNDNRSDSTGV